MRNYRLMALVCLQALTGCQYVSYYKTNTTEAPMGLQSSPENVCTAMGAMRGDMSFDRCVAEEEDRRWRDRRKAAGED